MEQLKCDRCGTIYDDEESVATAKKNQETWEALCRRDGDEPRGIIACPNISCTGELILEEARNENEGYETSGTR